MKRSWQLGTLQLDFLIPERLDANYIGEDGAKHHPVMLHRAIFGSLERFIGILIEHCEGKFPLWLAPVQIVIATISQDVDAYAREVQVALDAEDLRVELDLRNEKLSFKVREHSLQKVPIVLAVGQREAQGRLVSLRRLGSKESSVLPLEELVLRLSAEASHPDRRHP
jgi:threonyl-tRNA synthetase